MSSDDQTRDPCEDLVGPRGAPPAHGDGSTGQSTVPQGPEIDTADETAGYFPQSEIVEELKAVDRECNLIDRQHFFLPGYQGEMRHPGDALQEYFQGSSFASNTREDNRIDQFRYVAGKVWRFWWSERSGALKYVYNHFNPPGIQPVPTRILENGNVVYNANMSQIEPSVNHGVPFFIEMFESVTITDDEDEPTDKTRTSFDVRFDPETWQYLEGAQDPRFQQDTGPGDGAPHLGLLYEKYKRFVTGKPFSWTGPDGRQVHRREETTPLFPTGPVYDNCFTAPCAFYREEIKNSELPIQDSVFISPMITRAPDPNWAAAEADIAAEDNARPHDQDGQAMDPDGDGMFYLETDEEGEIIRIHEDPLPVAETEPALRSRTIDPEDLPELAFAEEHKIQSLYRMYNIEFQDASDMTNPIKEMFQIFPSTVTETLKQVSDDSRSLVVQGNLVQKAKDLLDTHVNISLSMHHNTGPDEIPRVLKEKKADLFLLNKMVQLWPNDPTFFTQVVDQKLTFFDPDDREAAGQVDHFGLNDKLKLDYRPQVLMDAFRAISNFTPNARSDSWDDYVDNYPDLDYYPLGRPPRSEMSYVSYRASTIGARNNIKRKPAGKRTFESILKGKKAHSEVIAYRIEKIDTKRDEVIQNFYIFNDPDIVDLDFLDTQVIYGKTYLYKIYTINLVVGHKYEYFPGNRTGASLTFDHASSRGLITLGDTIAEASAGHAKIELSVKSEPVLSLIEAPYFQQTVTLEDRPSLYPEIEYVPYAGQDDIVEFRFFPRSGKVLQKPIGILDTDFETIEKMLTSQIPDEQGRITYTFDSAATKYQILKLDDPPVSYQDFVNADVYHISARAPSRNFPIIPNKDYYLTCRTIDHAGISNPSPVYRYRINSYGNGITHDFEPYDMIHEQSYRMVRQEMTFESCVSIKPARRQRSVNFSNNHEEGETELNIQSYQSAPEIESLYLGLEDAEDSVWNRKFKFRIKSRTTGKMIDFNVNFKGYTLTGKPFSMKLSEILSPMTSRTELIGRTVALLTATEVSERSTQAGRIRNNRNRSDNASRGIGGEALSAATRSFLTRDSEPAQAGPVRMDAVYDMGDD